MASAGTRQVPVLIGADTEGSGDCFDGVCDPWRHLDDVTAAGAVHAGRGVCDADEAAPFGRHRRQTRGHDELAQFDDLASGVSDSAIGSQPMHSIAMLRNSKLSQSITCCPVQSQKSAGSSMTGGGRDFSVVNSPP